MDSLEKVTFSEVELAVASGREVAVAVSGNIAAFAFFAYAFMLNRAIQDGKYVAAGALRHLRIMPNLEYVRSTNGAFVETLIFY